MSEERLIPVAYVTKWHGAIRVYRNTTTFDKYLRLHNGRLAAPSQWTDDRGVAVARYLAALKRRADAARKEFEAAEAALIVAPVFLEAGE